MIVCQLIGLTTPGKHCASCEVQMKYKRTQLQGSRVFFLGGFWSGGSNPDSMCNFTN